MLNVIWAIMILVGILYGGLTGSIGPMTTALLESAGSAVSLCITMAGVMAFWMGLMEIGKEAGLIAAMTRGLSPVLTFLFPGIPKNHKARDYIATNFIANFLGLGWACTPAGLKAMEALAQLEQHRGTRDSARASREMCDFLILNISSLQLIPVSVIAYRREYGSSAAASILMPSIVATAISTLTAVIYCKWKQRMQVKK